MLLRHLCARSFHRIRLPITQDYRQCWKVAYCFGWMDNGRQLVVRDERDIAHDQARCVIAILLWGVRFSVK